MFKKILLPTLFAASLLCSIESTSAIDLLQYNKTNTVSGLVNDKAVTDNLKSISTTLMCSVNLIQPQVVGYLLKGG